MALIYSIRVIRIFAATYILRVLKMDASVLVESREFMQKRALRECLAYSGLTEAVRPDGQQYKRKHGR